MDERTRRFILALLGGVVFIAVVNGTMINVALPHIGKDFGVTEGTYGWLVTGYSLTFGIFNAINGRLADLIGKRRMYMLGIVFLGISSLAVAASPSIHLAIAIRLIQGAGAAALPVLGTTIIKSIAPPDQQGKSVGIILSTVGVAASIGPFLGGFLVQFAGWRFVFMFTGVSLLALPFAYKLLPKSLDQSDQKRFDWFGGLLVSLGVGGLLYTFELVESQKPLWQILTLVGVSLTLLAGFWAWIKRAAKPFVPHALFDPKYIACAVMAALTNASRFGSVILAPIFFTKLHNLSPIEVGATLFPGALAITLLSSKAGTWADQHGPRTPVIFGVFCMLAASIITAIFVQSSIIGATVGLTFFGLGFAFTQSPLVSSVNRIVPSQHAGAGVGMFMMIFFIGGAAGVALSVTLIELQPPQGFFPVLGGKYGNALLALFIANATGLLLSPFLPRAPNAQ